MSAAYRLIGKAHDYEVLAASHSEREALVGGGEHLAAATAFTVAAIIMREVASAEIQPHRRHRREPRRVLVSTDGEVTVMESPIAYRARPKALRVFMCHPSLFAVCDARNGRRFFQHSASFSTALVLLL